jgi:S-adenosylmethionine hydrolase
MKGVILGINPHATIVDVTHEIPPQTIMQGAMCLDDAFDAFPPKTIHLVVVDPDVGSTRRRIAAEVGNQRYVGPDNGLLTLVGRRHPIHRVSTLTVSHYHRLPVSPTFHGRDLFSPVAANWSLGVDMSAFGEPVTTPLAELRIPRVDKSEREVRGEIIEIDRFGNLTTNITADDLPLAMPSTIITHVGRQQLIGLSQFYSQHPAGTLLSLIGSSGRLEVAQNVGSAAGKLEAKLGDSVLVKW